MTLVFDSNNKFILYLFSIHNVIKNLFIYLFIHRDEVFMGENCLRSLRTLQSMETHINYLSNIERQKNY